MTRTAVVVVTVRCKNGHTREVSAGELGRDDFPMCQTCYRPMFPARASTRRRTLQTPKGNTLVEVKTSGATAGDILQWRRKRGGWTIVQVAKADGEWTPNEVALMEGRASQSSANVARYLRALDKLGRS